ncbi:exosortase/archaeosortase family protein [Secundilactobacillus malefermentans]|uniref:exosortase/archaeosortase family protein n=1 Tax=Secundilactobacillus malefermentans TaxID=176292 RepID=UPI0011CA7FC4|nr:exosortase/archaeosortase family protein [Secundilactobacillus malefermentans]QEA31377.1 exosortase/archaeosortase family protein [Secundilactobacillus malefermentans]
MKKNETDASQSYTDAYFEKGHIWLKIRQTLAAILGWVGVIVPILVTVISAVGYYQPHVLGFWHTHVGIDELQFFGLLILFAFVMSAIFTISMAIIQNRKRARVVEQWPTFDPIMQKQRKNELNDFMDERFGDAKSRESVRNYDVQPEKNLDTDEFKRLFRHEKAGDQDD